MNMYNKQERKATVLRVIFIRYIYIQLLARFLPVGILPLIYMHVLE